jgi:16S rRNA (adenine1518-N6/adenine1519-N6)-dimethyltransferase
MLECEPVRPPALATPVRPAPTPLDEVSAIATAKIPVREVLERYEIAPRKRFGQNFLHDPAVCRRIVETVAPAPGESVLEIGPGLGALTVPLLDAGARVTAVEVDRRIADYLETALADRAGFELVRGDVLRTDLDRVAPEARVLVGNLPYSITGPILARLLDGAGRFDRVVIMVQREVAARLTAGAGGRELGAPAVLLRLLYRVEKRFDVGRGAFLPPPEVVSSVLRLERIPGARLDAGVRDAVNRAYRQRRKMLRKTLGGAIAPESALAEALESIGRSPAARPEDLEPGDWPELVARVARREPGEGAS